MKLPRFLQDQFQRASASIVLNIAEGSGKRTPNDQRQFYSIALGSLRECRAVLDMEQIKDTRVNPLADRLSAILYVLSRKGDAQPSATQTENLTDTDTDTDSVSDSDSAINKIARH